MSRIRDEFMKPKARRDLQDWRVESVLYFTLTLRDPLCDRRHRPSLRGKGCVSAEAAYGRLNFRLETLGVFDA
jgi:hypothetical protein